MSLTYKTTSTTGVIVCMCISVRAHVCVWLGVFLFVCVVHDRETVFRFL